MNAEPPFDIEDQEFFLVLRVAHEAIDANLLDSANDLFHRLGNVRPENPHPRIGLALVLYISGQHIEAIDALRAILVDFPDAVFTRSLLAKFMKERGHVGWEQFAQETLDRVQSGVSAEMARELLGQSEPLSTADSIESTVNSPSGETTAKPMDVFQGRRA